MKNTPNVLIVFYTRRGNTSKMAEAVAEGAKNQGADVKLMRIADDVPIDIVKKDDVWYQKHIELEKSILLQIRLPLLKKWENLTLSYLVHLQGLETWHTK